MDRSVSDISVDQIDMAVLPGGMPGTTNLEASNELKKILKELKNSDERIAAICAAPSILGKMGMLEGIEATCYPGFEKYLKGAVVSRKDVVTDEKITTSKGPGTAIPFALELVRLIKGEDEATSLADAMQYRRMNG
jgi:protein deglycase